MTTSASQSPGPDTGDTLPLQISRQEMAAARDQGSSAPLGNIDSVARYAGTWWVAYENGWLRITDPHAAVASLALTRSAE